MNNEEVYHFILAVENQLKQDGVELKEYSLIFRVFLYFSFRTPPTPKSKNYFFLIKKFLLMPLEILKFRKSCSAAEILLVSPAQNRNVNIDTGQTINKHIEGLSAYHENKKIMVVEVGGDGKNAQNNLTPFVKLYSTLSRKLFYKKKITQLSEQFSRACNVVAIDQSIKLPFRPEDIKHMIAEFNAYKSFYQHVIPKHLKVQRACFIAYYNLQNLALIEVLKTRHVKTIDYQHGIQNDFHPMYSGIKYYKKEDVRGLPDEFWVWDKTSEYRSRHSFRESKILETGNLWNRTKLFDFIVQGYKKQQTKRVLVALQLWPDFFNFELIKVIESTPNIEWLFREHPISPLPDESKKELMEKYQVRFEDIDKVPVEKSILSAHICITGFSTVGIEAHQLGKKVIFVHENALLGLSTYIDGEEIFFAKDALSITNIIKKLFKVDL